MLMYYVVPLVMLMLMLVTKSYEKSISNAATIVGLLYYSYAVNYSIDAAFAGLAIVVFMMQIRAIINHNQDRLIKR